MTILDRGELGNFLREDRYVLRRYFPKKQVVGADAQGRAYFNDIFRAQPFLPVSAVEMV